jgi:mono/diheme cytochrome c family protein
MIDAKPIPNTAKVLATFCPGHGRTEHEGVMTIVDPSRGPDDKSMATSILPGRFFRDPYPISEDLFMAAGYHEIFLVDPDGRAIIVYELPTEWRQHGMRIQEPRPVRGRRKERSLPSRVNLKEPTGHVFLEDVYVGRNMGGVKRGDIKKLLVLESLPKPVNFSGGMEPLTLGGSFTLERILGTVPVEEDGSASFYLPAMRSVFFVALDENDMSVKRMQSFMTVQPGERTSCVGCHEDRASTPHSSGRVIAMGKVPSTVEPVTDVPDIFDFPRDIQPILDRHCVACHNYEKTEQGGPFSGGVILAGDRGPHYSISYAYLTHRRQFADGRNGLGNRAPRTIGSSASPLLKKLSGEHHGVKATPHELKMVRLWIETAAPYPGTYAALGSGMARYANDHKAYKEAFHKRCVSCHPKGRMNRHVVFNYTRPEKSLALLKPLAREAGGYGMREKVERDGKPVTETCSVFTDTSDPDYQALLSAIKAEAARLEEIKRFDMPGFRPNEHYIREMKFYGILPNDLAATTPIDPYTTDRQYWQSFWYRPD